MPELDHPNHTGIQFNLVGNELRAVTGDLQGPASATDGALAVFDGTSGKLVRNGPLLSTYTGFDSRYYTESEVDALIAGAGGAEALNDLSDVVITSAALGELLQFAGSGWVNRTLAEAGVAATGHTHTTADITDLSSYTGFDARYYTESEVNSLVNGAVANYLPLVGGELTGSLFVNNGANYTSIQVRRSDQSGVGQNDRALVDVTTGGGAARFLHLNGDTLTVSGSHEIRRDGSHHFDGALAVVADTTVQLEAQRVVSGNRAQLLSSSSANETYLRNALSDGTVDGSIIIDGANDQPIYRPGDTSGTRHEMWHNGNVPIEVGTWTPTLTTAYGFTPGINTATYTGRYLRVGSLVHVRVELDFDTSESIAVNDRAIMGGLPFTAGTFGWTNLGAAGTCWVYSGIGTGVNALGHVSVTSSGTAWYFVITSIPGTTIAWTNPLRATFTYRI